MNALPPQFRRGHFLASSPVKREKKGARPAKQDGIDEGTSTSFPSPPRCVPQRVPSSPASQAIRFTYLCCYHCSYQRVEFILSSVMYGRPLLSKEFFALLACAVERSCIRPLSVQYADCWPRCLSQTRFQSSRRAMMRDDEAECPGFFIQPCAISASWLLVSWCDV